MGQLDTTGLQPALVGNPPIPCISCSDPILLKSIMKLPNLNHVHQQGHAGGDPYPLETTLAGATLDLAHQHNKAERQVIVDHVKEKTKIRQTRIQGKERQIIVDQIQEKTKIRQTKIQNDERQMIVGQIQEKTKIRQTKNERKMIVDQIKERTKKIQCGTTIPILHINGHLWWLFD